MTTNTTAPPDALLNVSDIAAILGCSARTVYRLADAGCMPAPHRIGSLVRWRRQEIDEWMAAGCPAVRPGGGQWK
jgi:excisionase family DNA binding protein